MPITCRKITQWASECGSPQATMASGEALMRNDITPKATIAAMTEAMKRGWVAISNSGRGGGTCAAPTVLLAAGVVPTGTGGKRMKDTTTNTVACTTNIAA